jgi:hypothetical protein
VREATWLLLIPACCCELIAGEPAAAAAGGELFGAEIPTASAAAAIAA